MKRWPFCLLLDNAGYLPSLWDLSCYSWSCRCSLKGGFWSEIQHYYKIWQRYRIILYTQIQFQPLTNFLNGTEKQIKSNYYLCLLLHSLQDVYGCHSLRDSVVLVCSSTIFGGKWCFAMTAPSLFSPWFGESVIEGQGHLNSLWEEMRAGNKTGCSTSLL